MTYGHEEAGTEIVFYATDISTHNPFTDLPITCDNKDVLLILLYCFGDLSVSINCVAQHNTVSLRLIYEVLERDVWEALLGFHAFTGCDQTGKFYGQSKLSCWQTFRSSLPDVINAFQKLGVDLGNQAKDSLVKNVMDWYCKRRLSTFSSLGELRWYG